MNLEHEIAEERYQASVGRLCLTLLKLIPRSL
jgi:hypothetical protein